MGVAFRINTGACTECERCVIACSLEKGGFIRRNISRISIKQRSPQNPQIRVCRFDDCKDQPCIDACPADAISNHNGYVLIDLNTCTRCSMCVSVCPFQAIYVDVNGAPFKCDFCFGDPACVKECATQAISVKGA